MPKPWGIQVTEDNCFDVIKGMQAYCMNSYPETASILKQLGEPDDLSLISEEAYQVKRFLQTLSLNNAKTYIRFLLTKLDEVEFTKKEKGEQGA